MEKINLSKIKIHSNGDVEIHDNRDVIDGGSKDKEQSTKKSSVTPHPDLDLALQALKPYLCECFGINYVDEYVKSKDLAPEKEKAFKVIKPILQREYRAILDSIKVTGVSISGSPEKRSVVVTGVKTQANKSKTALNSPNVRLHQKTFGFEEDLREDLEAVIKEALLYHSREKKAQFELFEGKSEKESASKNTQPDVNSKLDDKTSTKKEPAGAKKNVSSKKSSTKLEAVA